MGGSTRGKVGRWESEDAERESVRKLENRYRRVVGRREIKDRRKSLGKKESRRKEDKWGEFQGQ